jgi:hypothetical protein
MTPLGFGGRADRRPRSLQMCMPTPDENMQSVRTFAEEVFGNKSLTYAADWLADDFVEHQMFPGTTPDKKGAIDSYRIFIAATADDELTSTTGSRSAIGCDQSHVPRHRQRQIPPRHADYRKGLRNGGHVHGLAPMIARAVAMVASSLRSLDSSVRVASTYTVRSGPSRGCPHGGAGKVTTAVTTDSSIM